MNVPWLEVTVWGTFVAIFAGLWVGFSANLARAARGLFHRRTVADYAAANGWTYQDRELRLLRGGSPYTSGSSSICTRVVTGTSRGEPFVAFEYAHESQVVTMTLPMSLPYIEVRPDGLAGRLPLAGATVDLESERFNRRFSVHADDRKFASNLLTPRLMGQLLEAPPLCWRIRGEDIVGWWPGVLSPAQIRMTLLVLHVIKDAIPSFVWHEYGRNESSTG